LQFSPNPSILKKIFGSYWQADLRMEIQRPKKIQNDLEKAEQI
jgi:hypothetical protein